MIEFKRRGPSYLRQHRGHVPLPQSPLRRRRRRLAPLGLRLRCGALPDPLCALPRQLRLAPA